MIVCTQSEHANYNAAETVTNISLKTKSLPYQGTYYTIHMTYYEEILCNPILYFNILSGVLSTRIRGYLLFDRNLNTICSIKCVTLL